MQVNRLWGLKHYMTGLLFIWEWEQMTSNEQYNAYNRKEKKIFQRISCYVMYLNSECESNLQLFIFYFYFFSILDYSSFAQLTEWLADWLEKENFNIHGTVKFFILFFHRLLSDKIERHSTLLGVPVCTLHTHTFKLLFVLASDVWWLVVEA